MPLHLVACSIAGMTENDGPKSGQDKTTQGKV